MTCIIFTVLVNNFVIMPCVVPVNKYLYVYDLIENKVIITVINV